MAAPKVAFKGANKDGKKGAKDSKRGGVKRSNPDNEKSSLKRAKTDEQSHSKDGVWVQKHGGEDLTDTVKQLNKLTAVTLSKDGREETKAREAEVREIYGTLKGRVLKFAMKHDACRSVQACFRFGDEEVREAVLAELEGKIVQLSKDKYSCFLVIALLRYGDEKHRVKVLNELRGHMVRLATHNCGSRVLQFAFTNCDIDIAKTKRGRALLKKNKEEAAAPVLVSVPAVLAKLRLEFYGPEFAIFGQQTEAEAEAKSATNKKRNFKPKPVSARAMFESMDLKKRRASLANLHRIVTKQAEKGILRLDFAHSIARSLVEHCEFNLAEVAKEDPESLEACEESVILRELVPLVAEASLAMISTSDGAGTVARCIAHASAKERKKFVRIFKGHVANLCFHEFGYLAIAALLASLDDTVLLKKNIIPEMIPEDVLANLVASVQVPDAETSARLVYMQTLTEHVKRYFRRVDLETVEPAEGTSKKDAATRVAELKEATAFPLAKALEGNVQGLLEHVQGADLLMEVLAASWASSLMAEVLETIKETPAVVEKPVPQRTLKRLVAAEGERQAADRAGFAERLWEILQPQLDSLIEQNTTCFLLVSLVEHSDTAESVQKEIKASKKCAAALAKATAKDAPAGLKVLHKLLSK